MPSAPPKRNDDAIIKYKQNWKNWKSEEIWIDKNVSPVWEDEHKNHENDLVSYSSIFESLTHTKQEEEL